MAKSMAEQFAKFFVTKVVAVTGDKVTVLFGNKPMAITGRLDNYVQEPAHVYTQNPNGANTLPSDQKIKATTAVKRDHANSVTKTIAQESVITSEGQNSMSGINTLNGLANLAVSGATIDIPPSAVIGTATGAISTTGNVRVSGNVTVRNHRAELESTTTTQAWNRWDNIKVGDQVACLLQSGLIYLLGVMKYV